MRTPKSSSTAAPQLGSDWTDVELAAAVNAYMDMLRCELEGTPYVKSDVNKALREGALAMRTKASIEFRMQNISATLYDLGVPYIAGYLPARNVGSRIKDRIKAVLNAQGISEFAAYIPTANTELLDSRVSELRAKSSGRIPPGSSTPAQLITTTTAFVRDPAVKRWVLESANGVCEGCDVPAPFLDRYGNAYLEVHHVLQLANQGSDRISNAVALCPNCHRRCHFAVDRDEFKLSLYERIPRLQIEVVEADESMPSAYVE
jgi:5-methylcytosine-specific restriction protein A